MARGDLIVVAYVLLCYQPLTLGDVELDEDGNPIQVCTDGPPIDNTNLQSFQKCNKTLDQIQKSLEARRGSAEHPIATTKALRLHSYGLDSSLSLRVFDTNRYRTTWRRSGSRSRASTFCRTTSC